MSNRERALAREAAENRKPAADTSSSPLSTLSLLPPFPTLRGGEQVVPATGTTAPG